jgi:predicted carbohydrate-binding protein with CBM5 and CBM33 domain
MKAMAETMHWLYRNKEAGADLLAKEMKLKPEHARRGWDFYTSTRTWDPNGDINLDGLQIVSQIYWEQTQSKGQVPKPAKYVDQSYLREALKELGSR